jgi:chromosomal replication initiation ATPase DnaA
MTVNLLAIRAAVAQEFGVQEAQLVGRSHMACFVRPRWIAMHLSRALCEATFQRIGATYGNRDTSTVRNACIKGGLLAADYDFRSKVERIVERLEYALPVDSS